MCILLLVCAFIGECTCIYLLTRVHVYVYVSTCMCIAFMVTHAIMQHLLIKQTLGSVHLQHCTIMHVLSIIPFILFNYRMYQFSTLYLCNDQQVIRVKKTRGAAALALELLAHLF